MSKNNNYLSLLKKELLLSTGCTEPIAVAYAAAIARNVIKEHPIDKIIVKASGNVIKNAMAVTIPGTREHGVQIAASLGAIAGRSDTGLQVLQSVQEEQIVQAKNLCKNSVFLSVVQDVPELYIDVSVCSIANYGRVIIQNYHDGIAYLEKDGKAILDKRDQSDNRKVKIETDSIKDILCFIDETDIDDLEIVKKSMEINSRICREGLTNEYGLSIGRTLMQCNGNVNAMIYAAALTSAGSDARMAGAPLPVMSNSGSGNQGICAIMPVVAFAEKEGASEEKLIRACALSSLVTIHAKKSFGRLSPLCGVVAAGIGASTGITYLLGGQLEEIEAAVQNMLGNVSGMVCDGAKPGCAMKVSTCVFAAAQSALAAMRGSKITPIEGIVEDAVEKTLHNVLRMAKEGMPSMDPLLLNIMIEKGKRGK